MRARAAVASVLASIGVLTVGWQLGAGTVTTAPTTTSGSGTDTTDPGASAPSGGSSSPAATGSGLADGTYTGADVPTRFGSVQVQITVAGGSITDVTALQLTDTDGRSVQISNRAAPILAEEVIASQSAQVQSVSGATYTTDAYLSSVQSAIDQASA